MNEVESIFANPEFTDTAANKVNIFTGLDMTSDVYYLKPNQNIAYHNHPNGDQVFFILKGKGKCYLNNGTEEIINVAEGSSIYVPSGVWHKIVCLDNEMIAVQVTKAGAGMNMNFSATS